MPLGLVYLKHPRVVDSRFKTAIGPTNPLFIAGIFRALFFAPVQAFCLPLPRFTHIQ
jgi:hypothetical protein